MSELVILWSERWSRWALEGALASAAVLAVAATIWSLARRRASAHVGYALLLLPLVPLVVPVGPLLSAPARTSSAVALVERLAVAPIEVDTPRPGSARSEAAATKAADVARSAPQLAAREAEGPRVGLREGLFLAWLAIVAALFTRFILVQLATARRVRAAREIARDALPLDLGELERAVGLGRRVRLCADDGIASPAAWGLFRPVLVLPPDLVHTVGERELRWVLLHELEHLRRGDLVVAGLQRVLQILWFFHPLAWLANRWVDELRECACDEAALARLERGSRRRCAQALVRLAERARTGRDSALALQSFFFTESLMERRVMRMIDTRREARAGLGLASLPVLLLGAAAALGSAAVAAGRVAPELPPPRADDEELGAAIARGLDWLVEHQAADGGWTAGTDAAVDASGEFDRHGVTGLALLALLEDPSGDGARMDAAREGLSFLAGAQDESGCFGVPEGELFVPSHMVATEAWMRAKSSLAESAWRPVAERALAFVLAAQNPYRGWRYSYPPIGDSDSFVTSLGLRALAAARDAGLDVPRMHVQWATGWLEDMTATETGRTGYSKRGSHVSRLVAKAEDFPVEYTEMLTAMAIEAQLDWGLRASADEIARGARLVAGVPPLWDESLGSIDYYHWLFGTRALARTGGGGWARWRASLVAALVPNQRADGSWPAIDAWSAEGSDVHATALATLALEAAAR